MRHHHQRITGAILGLVITLPGCTLSGGGIPFETVRSVPLVATSRPAREATPERVASSLPPTHSVPVSPVLDRVALRTEPPAAATAPPPPPPAPSAHVPEPERIAPSEEPILAAMRAYLQKRPDDAVKALWAYPERNQEMLLLTLPFLARLAEGSLKELSPEEATDHVSRLRALETRLTVLAALQIDRMVLCRGVLGFGRFVPLPEGYEYSVQEAYASPVKIYAELGNLSQRRQGPGYESWVAAKIAILNFKGEQVHHLVPAPKRYQSLSPRRDNSICLEFNLPPLPPGPYTLRLEVRDVTDRAGAVPDKTGDAEPHRTAVKSCDFRVAAKRARPEVKTSE